MQGSFQLYVRVHDDDTLTADDLVEKVYVQMAGLWPSNSYTAATSYAGQHGQGSITLQFQVVCDTNYYGTNCGHVVCGY